MMRGPKVELVLQRYTLTSDGGGGQTKTWTAIRKINGVLTFIYGDKREREDKETLYMTHQFWFSYLKGLVITEKDELSEIGNEHRYRVLFSDDILLMKHIVKVNLLQIK